MIENVCNSVRSRYIREKCVEIIDRIDPAMA